MKFSRHRLVSAVLWSGFVLSIASCGSSTQPTSPTPVTQDSATPPAPPSPASPDTARYVVVFDSTWSVTTHPTEFPATAHYSGLIGGTHSAAVTFWREGGFASAGIQQMAERGSKSPLDAEVMQAIAVGTAQYLLSGPNLGGSPASTSMEFDVSERHSFVTLVTMVAPSPDWFVGVSALPLFANDRWVDHVNVDLYAHDAGTDSGASYESADLVTSPRQPIARITGYPLAASGVAPPLGTFTFRRLQ
jgi:hypothetical protein